MLDDGGDHDVMLFNGAEGEDGGVGGGTVETGGRLLGREPRGRMPE